MVNIQKQIRLTQRDEKILRHVRRYGLTTIDVLHALFFPGQGRDAVKSTLRRLCGKGPRYLMLRPEQLDSQRVCYRLTGTAARYLGANREITRRLGPQAKVEKYALLWFVCLDRPQQRALFNPREFPDQFDIGPHRLPRSNFYVEQTAENETKLGFVLVDHGAQVRRIVRRAYKTLLRFLKHGWFDEYIQAQAFTLTVLTLSAGKQAAIQRDLKPYLAQTLAYALRNLSLPSREFPIELNVTVVPDLANIVPGRS